jgi:hypothetical protein
MWNGSQVFELHWQRTQHPRALPHHCHLHERLHYVRMSLKLNYKSKLIMIIKIKNVFVCDRKAMNKKMNASEQPSAFMFDYYIELLMSLSLSLLLMNLAYIIFSVQQWNVNLTSCMVFGVVLHYLLLNAFCWMLCFSILQYLTFNKVLFVIERFYLMSALFSFGN